MPAPEAKVPEHLRHPVPLQYNLGFGSSFYTCRDCGDLGHDFQVMSRPCKKAVEKDRLERIEAEEILDACL